MENSKATCLFFKGCWILAYFDIQIRITLGFFGGGVGGGKHFLESSQKSHKTHQRSYQ